LTIYWVNTKGERTRFRTIKPKRKIRYIRSYAGYAWIARKTKGGECVDAYRQKKQGRDRWVIK